MTCAATTASFLGFPLLVAGVFSFQPDSKVCGRTEDLAGATEVQLLQQAYRLETPADLPAAKPLPVHHWSHHGPSAGTAPARSPLWPECRTRGGQACVFDADPRSEGGRCLPRARGLAGSWCFTAADRSAWGICGSGCRPPGAAEALRGRGALSLEGAADQHSDITPPEVGIPSAPRTSAVAASLDVYKHSAGAAAQQPHVGNATAPVNGTAANSSNQTLGDANFSLPANGTSRGLSGAVMNQTAGDALQHANTSNITPPANGSASRGLGNSTAVDGMNISGDAKQHWNASNGTLPANGSARKLSPKGVFPVNEALPPAACNNWQVAWHWTCADHPAPGIVLSPFSVCVHAGVHVFHFSDALARHRASQHNLPADALTRFGSAGRSQRCAQAAGIVVCWAA